jgi:hypothetical protein
MTSEEFNALPKIIRDKVCENNRYWNVEDINWAECIVEDFKEKMVAHGMEAETVYWSGFCSQGDGACFEGGIDDFKLFIESHAEFAEFAPLVQAEIDGITDIRMRWKHHGHYYHENSLTYSYEDGVVEIDEADFKSPVRLAVAKQVFSDAEKLLDKFEEAVRGVVQAHCCDLYNCLEAEYDYLTSDEAIIESMESNDCLADEVATAKEQLGIEEDEHQSC